MTSRMWQGHTCVGPLISSMYMAVPMGGEAHLMSAYTGSSSLQRLFTLTATLAAVAAIIQRWFD